MPDDLDHAIADEYRRHVQAGDWGCVSLLRMVNAIQQARPELSQSAAIQEAMRIVRGVKATP